MASQKIRKSLQTIMCLAGTSLASICYSQGKDYKIVISSEIPAPQLIYPKDGETVDANNLVLDWENIPKASKYYIRIYKNEPKLGNVALDAICDFAEKDNLGRRQFFSKLTLSKFKGLISPGTTYYWSVQAETRDYKNKMRKGSNMSKPWKFITKR